MDFSNDEELIKDNLLIETGATLKEWCDITIIKYLIGEKNIYKWLIGKERLRPSQAEIIIKKLNINIKK